MSVLFNKAEMLEVEKQSVRKTLCDVTRLLEKDRQRLAFDLHDGPAQALSSALLQADILEDLIASAEAKRELASLKSILGQCLQELRTSIYSLKPQCITKKGLVPRIKAYAQQFSSRTGIKVDIAIESKEMELPEVFEINIFRVIQEALNNVHKHAHATQAVISITFSESILFCSVEDNGTGFNIGARSSRTKGLGGYGLASMRDRVEQFFGTFKIDSQLGKGTCISFSIPI
jgi:two-component system sensor histidine kinase DegS